MLQTFSEPSEIDGAFSPGQSDNTIKLCKIYRELSEKQLPKRIDNAEKRQENNTLKNSSKYRLLISAEKIRGSFRNHLKTMPQFARVTKEIKIQNKLTRSLGAADCDKREQKR